MSAALVRKSLALVDETFAENQKHNLKKQKKVFDFVPENKRIIKKVRTPRTNKTKKVDVLQSTKKLTIVEARKKIKSKGEILKSNLEKIAKIRNISTVNLDKEIIENIFTRGRTRRPVPPQSKPKKDEKTAFTEEDFKKFEEEYFGE
nr:active regulator of SIRT1-like [Onthophagus taurus]